MGRLSSPFRRRGLFLLAAALILVGLGWYGWYYYLAPPLPTVLLADKDRSVRESIEDAMSQVRRRPRSGAAWGHLGRVLNVHGFVAESRYSFTQAHRFDPANPRWPYLLGLAHLPDADAALPSLETAAELCGRLDPDNSAPRLLLAEVLFLKGRHAEAQAMLEKVVQADPENARAHYNLGLIYLAADDPHAALSHLATSVHSPSAQKKSCFQLARAHRELGQGNASPSERANHQSAAAEYAHKATQYPDDQAWKDPYLLESSLQATGRTYFYQLAEELLQQGKHQEAIELMERVIQEFPDDDSYLELTKTLIAAKEYDRAEAAARKTLNLRPDKVQGHYFLGMALFRQGVRLWKTKPDERAAATAKFQESEQQLRRAAELMPNHPWAYIYRGRCLRYLDRHAEAAEAFRTAIHQNPRQGEAYIFLSNLLAEDQKKEQAVQVLEQARQAIPDDANIRQALERLATGEKPSDPASSEPRNR